MDERARGTVYRRGTIRWLVLFTTWWLVVFLTLGGAHAGAPTALVVAMLAAEAVLLVLAIATYRSAVIVRPSEMVIREMFRTTRIPWPEVIAVEVGSQGAIAGPAASVRLRDGRSIGTPLWSGGLGAGNRATHRAIRSLQADVEAHVAAAASAAPSRRPFRR